MMAVQATMAPRRDRAGEPPPPAGAPRTRRRRRSQLAPYAFLAPGFVIFVIVMLLPIIKATQVSFYEWLPIPGADNTWVGLDNYTRALSDPQFHIGLVNAVVYMLVTVPGQ